MSPRNAEFWNRARRVRDKLVDRYLNQPDVCLIDIGYAPAEQAENSEEIVLRIHVRKKWFKAKPEERIAFPEQVDGIPVVVMLGDYQLQPNFSATDEE